MPTNFKNTNKTEVTFTSHLGLHEWNTLPKAMRPLTIKQIRITITSQKLKKKIWTKTTMRLTPTKWRASMKLKSIQVLKSILAEQEEEDIADNPADESQLPDDSTEEPWE